MVALLLTPLYVAVIVVVPPLRVVTNPFALIVATDGCEELQLAELVTNSGTPELYEANAVNCSDAPGYTIAVPGFTVRDCRLPVGFAGPGVSATE